MEGSDEKTPQGVLRKNSSTFYLAGLLLPKDVLQSAAKLYTLCRWVDDIADEANDSYRALFHLGKIRAAINGKGHVDELVSEVKNILKTGYGGVTPVDHLINTVTTDLGRVRIKTIDDLLKYSYGVAGTVGVMMSTVLKANSPKISWKHAVDLGIAMQLTNICRDVYADAKIGRRYIPEELLGDISPDEILEARAELDLSIRKSINRLVLMAEDYYESGLLGIQYLPFRMRAGIIAAAIIYREIGRILLRTNSANWQQRTIVSTRKKVFLFIVAMARLLIKPIQRNVSHNANLHRSIKEQCKALENS